jgi:hypothetical protein
MQTIVYFESMQDCNLHMRHKDGSEEGFSCIDCPMARRSAGSDGAPGR